MATKTISIMEDAYEILLRNKVGDESFSQVIRRTMKKKSIAEKYAKLVHVGEKRAMQEFSIIKQIINSHKEIAKELRLNEEEMEYLRNGDLR